MELGADETSPTLKKKLSGVFGTCCTRLRLMSEGKELVDDVTPLSEQSGVRRHSLLTVEPTGLIGGYYKLEEHEPVQLAPRNHIICALDCCGYSKCSC